MKSVKVVPVMIGALGTTPKRLEDYLRNINACWDRVGRTLNSKNSVSLISKDPPKRP